MIGMTATTVDETAKVEVAVNEAEYRNLGHAAASIRKTAVESIEVSDTPSRPGRPPHSRRGQLPASIRYYVKHEQSATMALVGPVASMVGESASPHEHGGEYQGMHFPRRPFMGPAMEANLDRFAQSWDGAVHQ